MDDLLFYVNCLQLFVYVVYSGSDLQMIKPMTREYILKKFSFLLISAKSSYLISMRSLRNADVSERLRQLW